MARASGETERLALIRQEFKDANQELLKARDLLEQSIQVLSNSAEGTRVAISSASSEASRVLLEAAEQHEKAGIQVSQGVDRLQRATRELEEVAQGVNIKFEAINEGNNVISSGMKHILSSLQKESKLIRWAIILAALAFVFSLANLALIVMK